MQEEISIPIIHMVRESVAYALKHFDHVKKIGIMATTGTITELSVFYKENKKYDNCLDAMDALVEESIRLSKAVYQ